MANKNQRKLPMKQVKKEYSKFDETTQAIFDEGEANYYVNIHPFIKSENITKTIKLFKEGLDEYEKLEVDVSDDHIYTLLFYNLIKVQTDLSTPKNSKDDIQFYIQLINTHYFKEIMSYFPEEELKKVVDAVYEILAANEKINRMAKKTQDEIKNLDIQSPELYEKIHGKKKRIPEA